MKIDNAARKPQAAEEYGGLFLAHSRTWQPQVDRNNQGVHTRGHLQSAEHLGESHAIVTLSLAAAALMAPAVWLAHAVLRWSHLI